MLFDKRIHALYGVLVHLKLGDLCTAEENHALMYIVEVMQKPNARLPK